MPNTDELQVHKVIVVPPTGIQPLLLLAPQGWVSRPTFYMQILQPALTGGDVATWGEIVVWEPVQDWF